MVEDEELIPDDRLKLIFVCCHPAVAKEARVALTLRLVCGLSTVEIAQAFLVSEPTMAQRLVRDAGFEPVVVGALSRAHEFDVGTPVYTRLMTAPQLRQALGLK